MTGRYAPFYCPDGPLNPPQRPVRHYNVTPTVSGVPITNRFAPSRTRASPAPGSGTRTSQPTSQPNSSGRRAPSSLQRVIQLQNELRRNEQSAPSTPYRETRMKNHPALNVCACTLCVGAFFIAPLIVVGFYTGGTAMWVCVALASASLLCVLVPVCCHCQDRRRRRSCVEVNVEPTSTVAPVSDGRYQTVVSRVSMSTAADPTDLPPPYSYVADDTRPDEQLTVSSIGRLGATRSGYASLQSSNMPSSLPLENRAQSPCYDMPPAYDICLDPAARHQGASDSADY